MLKDLEAEISSYTKLTYQITDKKRLEAIKKHIRQMAQASDRIHSERVRREAGIL